MGVPFHDRGPRTTDYIKALRAAWNGGGEVRYKSEYIDWRGFELSPQPAQAGGIPLIVGGVTRPAIRRAVALGDGWFPVHKDLDELARQMDKLRAEGQAQGRDVSRMEITSFYYQHREPPEALERYAELGVHRVLVNLIAFGAGDVIESMERFAEQVVRKYAA
jgi:alkanesulfonate monooxygenase SsuD/methylene tetrahydromethanopterin reductase-like flavin-dependent oxidoreductase (luciferase family)